MKIFYFIIVIMGFLPVFAQQPFKTGKFNLVEHQVKSFHQAKISEDSLWKSLQDFIGPERIKTTHKGKPDLMIPVILWTDDASVSNRIIDLGGSVQSKTNNIISCRIPSTEIDRLLNIPGIKKIDVPHRVTLHNSNAVPKAYPDVAHTGGYSGTGVICGVVDTGIDFTHPMFLNSDGTSRILYIWDQTDNSGPNPTGFAYGTEYTQNQINSDLSAGGNHSVVAQQDLDGHGTHVTGSFCGYDSALVAVSDTSFEGAAKDANIIFVKTTFYTDAINDGVNYIFQKAQAEGKPAVVNLSLGSQVGPHDGTDLYTEQVDQMVGPGKIVVRSAGNSGSDAIHVQGTVTSSSPTDVDYSVPTTSILGYLYLDFWYDGGDQIRVEIFEGGNGPDLSVDYGNLYNGTWYYVDNASGGVDPSNGLNNAYIRIRFPENNSFIRLTLTGHDGDNRTDFHVWMEMSSSIVAEFNSPTNAYSRGSAYSSDFYQYTLGNDACGDSVIAVGAYMSRQSWPTTDGTYSYNSGSSGGIMSFSSQGPTRDGRNKPECAAGGGMIISALTDDVTPPTGAFGYDPSYPQYRWMHGTSMSSPVMAGWVALLLEKHPTWTPGQVMNYIQNYPLGTSGDPTTSPKTDPGTWDPAFGYGVVDLTYLPDFHTSAQPVIGTGNISFTSGSMTIANVNFTSESMDSLKVELFLDSIHSNTPSGAKPLPRFYRISPVNSTGPYSADMTLYYTDEEFLASGISAGEQTLDLYRWTGGFWDRAYAGVDVNANSLTVSNVTQFSDWAISSTEDASLPVELAFLDFRVRQEGVELNWATHSETNHLGFKISRSTDGLIYSEIATYQQDKSLLSEGNSNSTKYYSWTDKNISPLYDYYYRLISVDVDGSVQEFEPVFVPLKSDSNLASQLFLPEEFELYPVYPNPFNPTVNFPIAVPGEIGNSNVIIRIYDITGRLIATPLNKTLPAGRYTFSWDAQNTNGEPVPTGIYLVRCSAGKFHKTVKIVYIK